MRVSAAGVGRRWGAFVADSVVLILLGLPATISAVYVADGASSNGFLGTQTGLVICISVAVLGVLGLWSMKGTTMGSPGYRLAQVRVVDVFSGAPTGPARAVARMLLVVAIPFAEFSVLFDGKRRGWHDKICRTVVVDISDAGQAFGSAGVGAEAVRQALEGEIEVQSLSVAGEASAASLADPDPAPERPADLEVPAARQPTLTLEEDSELTVWKDPTLPVAQLKWDDGSVSVIDGPAHVGRNPDVVQGYDTIPVADTTRSLSRSHIAVETDLNSILVSDLGSTNGTDVIYVSGDVVRLEPFRPVRVRSGDVLRFADRSCTVTVL